jgi:hypothetical protein
LEQLLKLTKTAIEKTIEENEEKARTFIEHNLIEIGAEHR